jgi:hypothetical protein
MASTEQLIPSSKAAVRSSSCQGLEWTLTSSQDEAAFIKRHLDALATQKKKFGDDYSPPERKRAKRAPIAAVRRPRLP